MLIPICKANTIHFEYFQYLQSNIKKEMGHLPLTAKYVNPNIAGLLDVAWGGGGGTESARTF